MSCQCCALYLAAVQCSSAVAGNAYQGLQCSALPGSGPMLSPGLRCTAEGLAHKVLSSLMASGQPPEDWQRDTVILKSGPRSKPATDS